MTFDNPVSIKEIAELTGATIIGNPKRDLVTGINEIHKVQDGDLTFVDYDKFYDKVLRSEASFVLIDQQIEHDTDKTLLLSDDPFTAYNSLTKRFRPFIPSTSSVGATAEIGEGTVIQPNVFIGEHVKIGKNCVIHPNVTIYNYSEIGDNVIIQSNTAIGSDAFYYKTRREYYEKMHTVGRTIIEDDVEIGSCCGIDSGVSGDTIVGKGSKLDNLIHLGHGVVLGQNCLIAGHTAIAGKTIIGNNVVIYGKVGINKCLHIGDGATIMAATMVSKSLEGGKTYFGTPAGEVAEKWRELAVMRQLPKMWDKLKTLA